jgi:hypothetical protein
MDGTSGWPICSRLLERVRGRSLAACATGAEETIQHLVGFAGRGSRHPSASCPVKKEGIPSRVMRCDGCVFGKRRICRSGVRVKSIMRSIHLGCTCLVAPTI